MRDCNPSTALDSSALFSLYLGALDIEDETRQHLALAAVLCIGRLGLRPDEFIHLHEGWVDWHRGEIRIPDRDPCSCKACAKATRTRHPDLQGQELADTLASTQWCPTDERGMRSIPFGWSGRLTATLARLFEENPQLSASTDDVSQVFQMAATRAHGLDPSGISPSAVRASAARFFADVGCSNEEVAAMMGIEPDRARPFVCATGGGVRTHLYETMTGQPAPDVRQAPVGYPLVCNPEPFEEEPFDPHEFDAAWRRERAREATERPLENPRSAGSVDAQAIITDEDAIPSHLDADSEVVSTSEGRRISTIESWAARNDRQRRESDERPPESDPRADVAGGMSGPPGPPAGPDDPDDPSRGQDANDVRPTASGGHGVDGPDAGADETAVDPTDVTKTTVDPRERLTRPVKAKVRTKYACSDVNGGQPTDGTVYMGQHQLLFTVREDGDITEHYFVPFDSIGDVVLDYTPTSARNEFDSTVAVVYEREDAEDRQVAVIELPGKKKLDFSTMLFISLLEGIDVMVVHPAREGGLVTGNPPERGTLHVKPTAIGIGDGDDVECSIQLADVIHVARGKMSVEEADALQRLSLRHLRTTGEAVTTQIAPLEKRHAKILDRFVMRNFRERMAKAQDIELTSTEKEVLVALYSTGSGMDISMILDKKPDEIALLLSRLKNAGLVRADTEMAQLTGTGQLVVSETIDDVNA